MVPAPLQAFKTVWDHFIPACAVVVRRDGDAIRYLHPRKGWKRVALRRFGQWRPVAENLLAETETK